MDNQLENLFTSLSISSDAITKEDFKKKDCKKGKGGWQKEDLLKICKDLGIKLTSKDKASKELLCEKINNYFNTNVVNVGNVATTSGNVNRPSPSDSATQFPVGITKIGNDGNMYKVILTSNGRKRWVKSTDTVTSDTVTSNVSTTNSNLENLPNEIILQILEKMPPGSIFNIIKASKRINMLFNKFKNSIIKSHIEYHGKVELKQPFLYNIKNKKEFKEAIEFVYQFICEDEVSQVNIKKWIKKLMDKRGELSADEAIIILEFIKKNNFKSSEFLLKYIKGKLDLGRIKNLEAFDVILDINYELNRKLQNSDDYDDEEEGGRWPGNEIFDNQTFEDWLKSSVQKLVLTDSNTEKINILKKNKHISDIARQFGDTVEEFLGGWGEFHQFENDREADNFKKYFPKLYEKYYKNNRTL
jgi:hypothetical protein